MLLKKQVKELKDVLALKNEEIESLKRQTKYTKQQETEVIQIYCYFGFNYH